MATGAYRINPRKVVSCFAYENVKELLIEKSVNSHSQVYIYGLVKEDIDYKTDFDAAKSQLEQRGRKYTSLLNSPIEVKLYQDTGAMDIDGNPHEIVFTGVITEVILEYNMLDCYCGIKAVSHSVKVDKKPLQRSFQDVNSTYGEIVNYIENKDEAGLNYVFIEGSDEAKKTESLIIQYKETNWKFVNRMASRLQKPVVVNDLVGEAGEVWIGWPKKKTVTSNDVKNINEDISVYKVSAKLNTEKKHREYKVDSIEFLKVGDGITLLGENLRILDMRVTNRIEEDYVNFNYTAVSEDEYVFEKKWNENIKGNSIRARVRDVKDPANNGRLQAEFMFDGKLEEKTIGDYFWFPYNVSYTSHDTKEGVFCMPELHDYIMVYFPNNNEGMARGLSSERSLTEINNEKFSDPDHKIFRTPHGKEIDIYKDYIKITSVDDKIYAILTEKNIKLVNAKTYCDITEGGITLNAGNITLNSGGAVMRMSGDSVLIDSKTMSICAEIIRINGSSSVDISAPDTMITGGQINVSGKSTFVHGSGSLTLDGGATVKLKAPLVKIN